MKNAKKILSMAIIMLFSLCLSTSCMLTGDNFKVRDLISFINENKEGDEKFDGANIYDEYEQKSIGIHFVDVSMLKEADEIIRLINRYLADNPEYFLNDDYYIEVRMTSVKNNYTQNFMCRNSMKYYGIGDKEYKNITVPIEDNLTYLGVTGIVLDSGDRKISSYTGLFPEIRELDLPDDIDLDDLGVFGTLVSLETVRIHNSEGQVTRETLAQLEVLYPEIEFMY